MKESIFSQTGQRDSWKLESDFLAVKEVIATKEDSQEEMISTTKTGEIVMDIKTDMKTIDGTTEMIVSMMEITDKIDIIIKEENNLDSWEEKGMTFIEYICRYFLN